MQLAHFSQPGTEAPSPTGAPLTIETSKEIGNRSAFSKTQVAFFLWAALWLDLRILLATVPHLLSVRPETIARVFRFPQVSDPAKPEDVLANGGAFGDHVGPALAE